jgi:hypothetical protein
MIFAIAGWPVTTHKYCAFQASSLKLSGSLWRPFFVVFPPTRLVLLAHCWRSSKRLIIASAAQFALMTRSPRPAALLTRRGRAPHTFGRWWARRELCPCSIQTGFAPAVPHFANLPLAALQRVAFTGALSGHLMNLPFASRQGAAMDGAAVAHETFSTR